MLSSATDGKTSQNLDHMQARHRRMHYHIDSAQIGLITFICMILMAVSLGAHQREVVQDLEVAPDGGVHAVEAGAQEPGHDVRACQRNMTRI